MATWDTFVNVEFKDLQEDQEQITIIRDLTPGRDKYRSTYARVKLSKDSVRYPETVWIRLGKGQLIHTPCSMHIVEFIDVCTESQGRRD